MEYPSINTPNPLNPVSVNLKVADMFKYKLKQAQTPSKPSIEFASNQLVNNVANTPVKPFKKKTFSLVQGNNK